MEDTTLQTEEPHDSKHKIKKKSIPRYSVTKEQNDTGPENAFTTPRKKGPSTFQAASDSKAISNRGNQKTGAPSSLC